MNHDDIILYSLIKKNSGIEIEIREDVSNLQKDVEALKFSMVGKDVSNETYIIDDVEYSGGLCGEIFNDYTNNKAIGEASHAEGFDTLAFAIGSHSEGIGTKAIGNASHAEGIDTRANGVASHACGKYNIEDVDGKFIFIIGNGESDESRSNAFSIDYDGLIYQGNSSTGVDLSTLADKTSVYTKSEIDTKIKEKISSSSCIVCSPNQPENLKKGLWIEANSSDKDINIVDSCDDLLEYNYGTCSKSNSTLTEAVYGTSAASVGSKCYVFGGDLHDSDSPIQIYDTETDILTLSGAVLDLPNSDTSATSVGSKCYIFGGWNKGNYYNYIQIYDTTTNVRTTSSATLNTSLVSTSAASVGSKCYIFGGGRYNGNTLSCYSYIQMYDTTTNVGTTSSATLAKSLYETSATSIGSKCYIFGGADSSGNFYDYIQIYDTTTNVRTTSSAVLNKAVDTTSAAFMGSKCYIFGGYYQGTTYANTTSIIQIYDTETNVCTLSNAKLATSMKLTSATSIGSKCYIFGGLASNGCDYIQIFSEFAAKMSNNHFSDSILITLKNDNDKQIANKTALSVQGKVYSYKPVENVYYVDSDDIVSELTYHKIENNQTV